MDSTKTMTMMTKCEDPSRDNKVKVSVPLSLRAMKKKPSSVCDQAQLLVQNHANFKRSSDLARCMFYADGSWVDYSDEVAEVMKLGFAERMPMVEAEIQNSSRLFDFYRMVEIELKTGKQRSISWIDVRGKCFFPKVFVNTFDDNYDDDDDKEFSNGDGSDENCPKIELEINIGESSGSSEGYEVNNKTVTVKRKRDEIVEKGKMEGGSSNYDGAKRRITVAAAAESQSARWPRTRALGAEDKGYAVVEKLFLSALEAVEPGAKVTAIHQCVRMEPMDKAKSQVFAKQMEIIKRVRGESNLVFAWYGASAKGVESILTHGFGVPCELSGGERPGVGIHLSPVKSPHSSALFSEADENGEKHVILCRVILGKCEKVEVGSGQSHPSSMEYDTGVDDLTNPRWYTVWHANMNTHILPECVVSYRPVKVSGSANGVANMIGSPHPSVLIAKLISKLKSLLPPPKILQLGTLCGMYKAGKLGKDIFMKQLRYVVGDDVLRSTLQEIRG